MAAAAKRVRKSAEAYRSIGEAANELGLQPHVLRYWERKFTKHLKPLKRPDGRRMFRPEDLLVLKAIQLLVHNRGLTLKGAQKLISEQGVERILNGQATLTCDHRQEASQSPAKDLQNSIRTAFESTPEQTVDDKASRNRLETALADLVDIKARLDRLRHDKAA